MSAFFLLLTCPEPKNLASIKSASMEKRKGAPKPEP